MFLRALALNYLSTLGSGSLVALATLLAGCQYVLHL